MKNRLSMACLLVVLSIPQVFAMYELNGSFGYSKQVYGANRQNSLVARSYSGAFAVYFLSYTAIEFNCSQSQDTMTENDTIAVTDNIDIVSIQNKVKTNIYGIGIRQALPIMRQFIVPVFSIGYAKQVKSSKTTYTLDDDGERKVIQVSSERTYNHSAFGSFMLKINLSRTISLTGSVKTVFPAFEFSQARDNVSYEAGLSIMF